MRTRTLFIVSMLVVLAACAKSPPAADLSMVPHLGDDRDQMERRLAPYRIENPDSDSPIAFYRFKADEDLIRLSFIYALRKDGKDVLSGINIKHDNIEDGRIDLSDEGTALPDASRRAVIDEVLPDRKPVAISSLSQAVQQDAAPAGKSDEDSAFFSSAAATRHVVQNPYWSIPQQRWIYADPCPASGPKIVQVWSGNVDGVIQEGGIYSEWLYDCMRREMFK